MVSATTERLLHHLRRTLAGAADSDRCLLARFTSRRDEAAFAALVSRHGPMVLGVCRRVLGDNPATEDAFQATFLTLARRSASIRARASAVGCTAWPTASPSRLAPTRRGVTVTSAGPGAAPPFHDPGPRLPRIGGRPRRGAAAPAGALPAAAAAVLSRRPHAGRGGAPSRLEPQHPAPAAGGRPRAAARPPGPRGATLSVGLFAVALATGATKAAVPAALARATAGPLAAGTDAARAAVEALVRGGLGTAWLTRGKVALALLLAVVASVGAWAGRGDDTPAAQPAPPDAPAATPRDASLPPGALFRLGTAAFRHRLFGLTAAAFSPDGKLLATAGGDKRACVWDAATGRLIHTFATGVNHFDTGLAFAPDGKRLAVADGDGGFVVVNVATGREESRTRCPAKGKIRTLAAGFSPDGRPLMLFEGDENGEPFAVYEAVPAGARHLRRAAGGPGSSRRRRREIGRRRIRQVGASAGARHR